MLSRVLTMKKRRRDKVRPGNRYSPAKLGEQSEQARWMSLGDSAICYGCQPDTTPLQSIDLKPVEGRFNTVQMFSPMSAAPPITILAGNQGAVSIDLQRFVSPNTANVASALSLLSRLPYCQPQHWISVRACINSNMFVVENTPIDEAILLSMQFSILIPGSEILKTYSKFWLGRK